MKFIKKEKLSDVQKLTLVGFVTSISIASVSSIWAIYFNTFLHSDAKVGFLTALMSLVAIIGYFSIVPLLERNDKSRLFAWALFLLTVSYMIFAFVDNIIIVIFFGLFIHLIYPLRTSSLGILFRDKSKNIDLSKNEGFLGAFRNLSWLIGPILAGYIAKNAGVNSVFLFASVFSIMAFLGITSLKIKDNNLSKKAESNVVINFWKFLKNKDRLIAYILTSGISFWWAFIYTFVPLFMIENNYNELQIGLFLFGVAIPLIMLEYYFAKLAGKIGFKKIFIIGYLIPFVLVSLCFFISNINVILLFLVLSSVGLAMLEPTTEAYFFDILKKNETLKYYSPFKTSIHTGMGLSKLLASIVLVFLPFKYTFLSMGIILMLLFFLTFKTRNIIEAHKALKKYIQFKKYR